MTIKYRILFFLILIISGYVIWRHISTRSERKVYSSSNEINIAHREFSDEGMLYFIHPLNKDTVRSIHIELADDPEEIMQGLMYRNKLASDEGMLFIYGDMRERTFWMDNTQISLDIIFINDEMKIVHIAKHTIPYARDPIPSMGPAQYVVEVNAGFCNNAKIEVGFNIKFIIHKSVNL